MSAYTKADYEHMVHLRVSAFVKIAQVLGKEHTITKMMGSLAWGRHGAEYGPGGGLRDAIEAYGHLNGYFACLNCWALDNDQKAQEIMLNHFPRGMASAKSS